MTHQEDSQEQKTPDQLRQERILSAMMEALEPAAANFSLGELEATINEGGPLAIPKTLFEMVRMISGTEALKAGLKIVKIGATSLLPWTFRRD